MAGNGTVALADGAQAAKENKGTVVFTDEVMANIAGMAAIEVDGVAGLMGNFVDGIGEMLGKNDAKKGVKVNIEGDRASIGVAISAQYGNSLVDIAREVQKSVKQTVETMTGITVEAVNVNVQALKLPAGDKASA